jgi:hypothetical protein
MKWWDYLLIAGIGFLAFTLFWKGCNLPPDNSGKVDSLLKSIHSKDSIIKAFEDANRLHSDSLNGKIDSLKYESGNLAELLEGEKSNSAFWKSRFNQAINNPGQSNDSLAFVACEEIMKLNDSLIAVADAYKEISGQKDEIILQVVKQADSTNKFWKGVYSDDRKAIDSLASWNLTQSIGLTKSKSETKFWKTASKILGIVIVGVAGALIAK